MAILHLMCGVPGAGKTTRAKELAMLLPAMRLTPDEWLLELLEDGNSVEKRLAVESVQWDIAVRMLDLGADVILENGFRTLAERDEFRARATTLGVSTRIHFMDAPFEELVRRLAARNAEQPPDAFTVSEQELIFFVEDLEPPTEDELTTMEAFDLDELDTWSIRQRQDSSSQFHTDVVGRAIPQQLCTTEILVGGHMATLHLVCVASGTEQGNPTLYLERELRAVRLAAREWLGRLGDIVATPERLSRMETIQWEIAERALLCGVDVLLEIDPKTRIELEPYRTRATELGAETRIYAVRNPRTLLTVAEGVLQAPAMDEGW